MAYEQTPYAKKYTEAAHGKSGLTPLAAYFPDPNLTSDQVRRREYHAAIENYQRGELYRFTTQELVNLDAVTIRPLQQPNLENPIYPTFLIWESKVHRSFKRRKLYPIGHGFDGDWVARNPVVDPILKPTLVLASRIMANVHFTPWVISPNFSYWLVLFDW